jgi:hypothetical protein
LKIGTAEEIFGTAEEIFGTAEEIFGTAEEIFGTAEEIFGTAEEIFGIAAVKIGTAEGSGDGRLFEENRQPEDKHDETESWRWPFLVSTVKFIAVTIAFPSTLPRFFFGGGMVGVVFEVKSLGHFERDVSGPGS